MKGLALRLFLVGILVAANGVAVRHNGMTGVEGILSTLYATFLSAVYWKCIWTEIENKETETSPNILT